MLAGLWGLIVSGGYDRSAGVARGAGFPGPESLSGRLDGVSRRHAEFRRENGEYVIADTASLNGTHVNRKPAESVALANGDEIQMGKFRLVFRTRPTTH